MAIKAQCGSCKSVFPAKDALAGKRVKCPKCSNPMTVPKPKPKKVAQSAAAATSHNPMLDLLDEVNVRSAVRGPQCPNCSEEMPSTAVVCVSCGYNVETGLQLSTKVYEDEDEEMSSAGGMTDAERIMAKAEKDIEDSPVTAHGQDFGDGADSFVIAGVAGIILMILVGIGLTVIFTMDIVSQSVASWFISFIASVLMILAMATWITIVAFLQKPAHGIACILTGGLWCVVYGFLQGKQLILPTVILLGSYVVGLASGLYTMYNGTTPTAGP